ncbi:unnamed protein product [Natator depressus]
MGCQGEAFSPGGSMEEPDPHPMLSPAVFSLSPLQVNPVTDVAMGPRGPRPLLFLTLVLLAVCLAQLSEGATYRQFLTRQVDFPKTSASNDWLYCNCIMRRQGLTRPVCKPTNTFIHAPAGQVQAICSAQGGATDVTAVTVTHTSVSPPAEWCPAPSRGAVSTGPECRPAGSAWAVTSSGNPCTLTESCRSWALAMGWEQGVPCFSTFTAGGSPASPLSLPLLRQCLPQGHPASPLISQAGSFGPAGEFPMLCAQSPSTRVKIRAATSQLALRP